MCISPTSLGVREVRYAECLGRDSVQCGSAAPAPTPVAITAFPTVTAALVIDVFVCLG